MVSIKATSLMIGGRPYNKDKNGYPGSPSVYSGVSVSFGADSCLEHPDPTTASISLWVPKSYGATHMPRLGEEVLVNAQVDNSEAVKVFSGYVDKVVVSNHHTAPPTGEPFVFTVWDSRGTTADWYYVTPVDSEESIDANGALKIVFPADEPRSFDGTGTVRLHSPKQFEVLPGVTYQFSYALSGASGSLIVRIKSATSATLATVNVQPGTWNLTMPAGAKTIEIVESTFVIPSGANTFTLGPITMSRTQTLTEPVPGYRINVSAADATAKAGRLRIGDEPWPSHIGMERLFRIANLTTRSDVRFFRPGLEVRDGSLWYSMPSEIGGEDMIGVTTRAIDVDSVNALEFYQDTAMSAGLTVGSVNNEVTPNYKLLLPQVLAKNATGAYLTEPTTRYTNRPVPVIPVKAIVDSAFSLDTTETVNQIKLNYFVRKGTVWPGGEFTAVEDASMSITSPTAPLSAPVTRTIQAENQVNDPYSSLKAPALDPVNSLAIRARAALSAQSVPRWRLANGMQLVLGEVPYSTGILDLIEEAGRFGQLVRIDGAPAFIDKYQRIKSGTIVFGDEPSLEFELEPVDYSGPTALTRDTAYYDATTRAITIGDLKTITSETLRSVGAR